MDISAWNYPNYVQGATVQALKPLKYSLHENMSWHFTKWCGANKAKSYWSLILKSAVVYTVHAITMLKSILFAAWLYTHHREHIDCPKCAPRRNQYCLRPTLIYSHSDTGPMLPHRINSSSILVNYSSGHECKLITSTLFTLFTKTSYRHISWSLEATRLHVIMIVSLWNLTGISATLLPRCLSYFRAIGKV